MEQPIKTNFNINEIRTYINDFECIKYLLKESNRRKIDSNLYYELLFFKDKFKRWLDSGIEDDFIRLQVVDFYNCISTVLDSVTDAEVTRIYNLHTTSKPLKGYDEIRYKNTNVNFNLGYTRQKLTRKLYKEIENYGYNIIDWFYEASPFLILMVMVMFIFNMNIATNIVIAIMVLIAMAYNLMLFVLIYDSDRSFYTGKYVIQKPEEYDYIETDEKYDEFRIYDKVWRNQIVAYYKYGNPIYSEQTGKIIAKENEIYNSLINKNVLAKDKFQLLVDIENHFLSTYEPEEEETAESVQKKVDDYLASLDCINL